MTTLKKIDKLSSEGVESSLNIFDLPFSNVSVNKSSIRELLPLTTVTQSGPYVFRLWADNQFLDLKQTWLYLELSIQKLAANGIDWGNLEPYVPARAANPRAQQPVEAAASTGDHVSVCQSVGQSFVRQLKISMNSVEVFDSGVLYPYRSYMLQELGLPYEVKSGLYEAQGYSQDGYDQDSPDNKGLVARAKWFKESNLVRTMSKLNFDLAMQPNYMLNNTDILFTIYKSADDFLLHVIDNTRNPTYRVKLHDIKLYVKTVDVTQSLNNAISRHLEKTSAKYAVRRIEVRNAFIGQGRVDFSYNIFNSIIPRRMIVVFVAADAFNGSRTKSPFIFEHAKIQTISAEANGLTYPSTPYTFDFDRNNYMRAFIDMYAGLGLDIGEKTNGINMYRFKKGWCFFVIPMNSTLDDNDGFELIRNGATAIKVGFKEPVGAIGYEMIVLAEFYHVITIDRDRVLTSDGAI